MHPLSTTTRRVLSWTSLVLISAACVDGYYRLPGAGGGLAEMRWLLRGNPAPAKFNLAGNLLRLTEQEDPVVAGAWLESLLCDSDLAISQNTVLVLRDRIGSSFLTWQPHDRYLKAVESWLEQLDDSEKENRLAEVLVCMAMARQLKSQYSADDPWTRWLIAGTTLAPWSGPRNSAHLQNLQWWLHNTDLNQLAELLNDPVPRVRWGAAYVLVVGGDQRGLPRLVEWLDTNPPLANGLDAWVAARWGENWRERAGQLAAEAAGEGNERSDSKFPESQPTEMPAPDSGSPDAGR